MMVLLYTDTYNERIWNQTYEMAKPTIDMYVRIIWSYMTKKGTQIYIMTFAGAGIKHRDNDDN